MYKLSKSGGQMETVTTAKFLRITDMRSFDWFDGKPRMYPFIVFVTI